MEGDRGGRLASDSGKATRERHQLTEKDIWWPAMVGGGGEKRGRWQQMMGGRRDGTGAIAWGGGCDGARRPSG